VKKKMHVRKSIIVYGVKKMGFDLLCFLLIFSSLRHLQESMAMQLREFGCYVGWDLGSSSP
jgi:hypothetical protein